MKSKQGIIFDLWNPHLINPNVFNANTPTGYKILLEGGSTRICTEDDFKASE